MALPTMPVLIAPANPYTGGLYDAATIIDPDDARHLAGVALRSPNRGPAGTWPTGCPTPDDAGEKVGSRPDPEDFPGVVVWAADGCKTVGVDLPDGEARAVHTLRLREPVEVEKHTARLLDTITGPTATDIVDAVSQLDEALAAYGYTGVVHARRGLLAAAEKADMVVRQGSRLMTPGGNRWAFGAGYTALGNKLVGTGPVVIHRSPVHVADAIDARHNDATTVAERAVAVGWDQPTTAITIS